MPAFSSGFSSQPSLATKVGFLNEYEGRYGPDAGLMAWKAELARRAMLTPIAVFVAGLMVSGGGWIWFWLAGLLLGILDLAALRHFLRRMNERAAAFLGRPINMRSGPPRSRTGYLAWCDKEGLSPYPGRGPRGVKVPCSIQP